MFFSEDDFKTFLNSHPDHIYDEAKGIVRKKTKKEHLEGENWIKDPNRQSLLDKLLGENMKDEKNSSSVISSNPSSKTPLPEESPEQEKKKKKNKYRNEKVYEYENGFVSLEKDLENNGKIVFVFDSKKEFRRWNELKALEQTGEIFDLQRQVPLIIQESFKYEGKKISEIKYKADHVYIRDGRKVIEDVKPFDVRKQKYLTTKDFNLKWKLLKYKYQEYLFEIF